MFGNCEIPLLYTQRHTHQDTGVAQQQDETNDKEIGVYENV